MKNFGNRIGFPNKVVDARDVLRAKQTTDGNRPFNQYNRPAVDARDILTNRQPVKPNLKFTIPTKTIQNNIFRDTRKTVPFSDPGISQGIFSRQRKRPMARDRMEMVNTSSIRPEMSRPQPQADATKRGRVDEEPRLFPSASAPPRHSAADNGGGKRPETAVSVAVVADNGGAEKRATVAAPRSVVSPIQGYRIELKNLVSEVTVDDVHELFTSGLSGTEGELRSCSLVRPGYAEVVFRVLESARRAVEEFDGRELDGRPMRVELVTVGVEAAGDSGDAEVRARIARIQSSRKSSTAAQVPINKDAVIRSMYLRSTDAPQPASLSSLLSTANKKRPKFPVRS